MTRVTIHAPATTANLGPGFDCLGAALDFGVELRAEPAARHRWTVVGDDDPPPDLVLDAARRVAEDLPQLALTMTLGIPLARGLGSSAAAIAAGLLLGCAVAEVELPADELLSRGLALEGHADNLAACLFGGLVLVLPSGEVVDVARSSPLRPVVLVPQARLETAKARRVLPEHVSFRDAVLGSARAAGLVGLLSGAAGATPARLLECTDDVLHQQYRAPLMPVTARTIESLRAAGLAAVVSGAGPSVLVLALPGQEVPTPDGWTRIEASWDERGARVTARG